MIKKETRILGLGAPTGRLGQIPVVGVVFRGNLWLDGIISCQIPAGQPDCPIGLIQAIVRSKQHSQIRAVILPREDLASGIRIDISDLSRKINLPVISIIRKRTHWKTQGRQPDRPTTRSRPERFTVETAGGFVRVKATGISREETREVFAVGCANGQRIPEALRVAEMVAKQAAKRGRLAETT